MGTDAWWRRDGVLPRAGVGRCRALTFPLPVTGLDVADPRPCNTPPSPPFFESSPGLEGFWVARAPLRQLPCAPTFLAARPPLPESLRAVSGGCLWGVSLGTSGALVSAGAGWPGTLRGARGPQLCAWCLGAPCAPPRSPGTAGPTAPGADCRRPLPPVPRRAALPRPGHSRTLPTACGAPWTPVCGRGGWCSRREAAAPHPVAAAGGRAGAPGQHQPGAPLLAAPGADNAEHGAHSLGGWSDTMSAPYLRADTRWTLMEIHRPGTRVECQAATGRRLREPIVCLTSPEEVFDEK